MQIREKEADIDALITPIEEMYSLLLRYEVIPYQQLNLLAHDSTMAAFASANIGMHMLHLSV